MERELSLKGIPTPEIMEKVDRIKKVVIDDIYHPWRFIRWERYKRALAIKVQPDTLVVFNVTNSAEEMSFLVYRVTGSEMLFCVSQAVIGYDLAYRLRIQDMFNEMILDEDTYKNPRKELKRLWKIYERRECVIPTYMLPKSRKVFNLIYYALCVPHFKRKFVRALKELDREKIKFTEDDKEWIKMRTDYKFYA